MSDKNEINEIDPVSEILEDDENASSEITEDVSKAPDENIAPESDLPDTVEEKNLFARSDTLGGNLSFGADDDILSDAQDASDESSLGIEVRGSDNSDNEEKEKVKEIVKEKIVKERGVTVRSFSFTIIYVMVVVVLALLLAFYLITRANDAFGFQKFPKGTPTEETMVTVTIDNPNVSLDELSKLLHEAGAIKYPEFFEFYVKLKNDGEFGLKKGTYTFSAANNYDVILSFLDPVPPRETIWITIPEGYTTDDIIELFVSKGIGTKEGFYDAIENAEFDYWFLKPLTNENMHDERFYRLDGYLYPDTYLFYTNSSEKAVLDKILRNFNAKFAREYEARCKELGITVDEAMILASMIQAEAKYAADFEFVSAVFHNRLKKKSEFPKFESDVTLQYYFRHVEGAVHAEITKEDLDLDSQYNTRKYPGFTPGPICSPSLTAIKAALYPADQNFYYFISKSNGYLVYSKTYAEHIMYSSMSPEELLKVDQKLFGDDEYDENI
ncbi:MAG: endolytic transglycosylase MltG [Clostridia bacterium]|nr:endolytic transglycosylase MltG [Clostridia bacterium]